MDVLESLRIIKQLLDRGEITEEEFELRKKKILSADPSVNENVPEHPVEKKPEPMGQNEKNPVTTVKIVKSDLINNAGKSIILSARFTIASACFAFIAVSIAFLAFGDIIKSLSKGWGMPADSGISVAGLFAGLSFISWIISIAKLTEAGHSLKNSTK